LDFAVRVQCAAASAVCFASLADHISTVRQYLWFAVYKSFEDGDGFVIWPSCRETDKIGVCEQLFTGSVATDSD
jgi:hypothetical protein